MTELKEWADRFTWYAQKSGVNLSWKELKTGGVLVELRVPNNRITESITPLELMDARDKTALIRQTMLSVLRSGNKLISWKPVRSLIAVLESEVKRSVEPL